MFKEEDLSILNQLRDASMENARAKGFKDPPPGLTEEQWNSEGLRPAKVAIYIANQHGETSEFWEAARVGTLHKPCDKAEKMKAAGIDPLTCGEEELADQFIRLLDTAAEFNINVAKAIVNKMAFNATRPHRHGGKLVLALNPVGDLVQDPSDGGVCTPTLRDGFSVIALPAYLP